MGQGSLLRVRSALQVAFAFLALTLLGSEPSTPAEWIVGPATADAWRIENAWPCGGGADCCVAEESDAMVLTRIALAESPSSVNDQVYIMWLIRLRAELGYKEAGYQSGYRDMYARWGPPTTIKQEALCNAGCQFQPAQAIDDVYFPCNLSTTSNLRLMLCPTDDQLPLFSFAHKAAVRVLVAPLSDFPVELRGYDEFRSPSVTGPGQFNRPGGLRSIQFWQGANIWRDASPDDNLFWKLRQAAP